MSANVEIKLKLTDEATRGFDTLEKRVKKSTANTAKMAEKMAERTVAAERYINQQSERFTEARTRLGIKSEQDIQREIMRTQQAYQMLAQSGLASSRELARAKAAEIRQIRELNAELKTSSKLQTGLTIAAGAAGAGYVIKTAASQAMSFDERLANMANTAYAERDVNGKRMGMQQLESAINRSVGKGGGGTRDQAAETLDALIASGALSVNESINVLPALMKAGSAANANPTELAAIGIRAMQTFKIKPEDMPNVLNMALAGGQAGGFELKDMSKWLPQQMAAATMSGLSGRGGFAKLVALNQASAITAGTKDEAGNNVVNLLAKINSSDTANDAKKLGIDLPGYLQKQRSRGVDSIDAFANLVDKTVAKRADYQALQKKLRSSTNDADKRDTLESMATIAQGSGIGKLIQDRQALMALLGMMNNREYMQTVLSKVRANDVGSGGAIDSNYALISGTSSFQVRQAEQAKDAGTKSVMDGLTPAIGKVANAFTDLATKHPVLAGAATLATTGLIAVAGASSIAALSLGGKGGGGAIAGMASRFAPKVGKLLGRGAVLGGVAMLGDTALEAGFGEDSKVTKYGSAALDGAATGALIGSFIPVIGTAIGAALGASGGLLYEYIKKPGNIEQAKMQAELTVNVQDDRVHVTKQSTKTSGPVDSWIKTGSIWGGVPG